MKDCNETTTDHDKVFLNHCNTTESTIIKELKDERLTSSFLKIFGEF